MAGLVQDDWSYPSVAAFRRFLEGRSDKERWELLDGVAVRLERPTVGHQFIANNLLLLLHDALEIHAPMWTAYLWIGVNLAPTIENYDLLPDLIVTDLDAAEQPNESYADRVYLVAEIAAPSEGTILETKRCLYKQHEACNCILTVPQDRFEVRVDLRADSGWEEQLLTSPEDILVLPDFGLRCKLSDLYRGTALQPRNATKR
jgi:hypothetical protein